LKIFHIGQHYDRTTAALLSDARRGGDTVWVWRCSCGREILKTPDMVGEGKSTMCPQCARRLKARQAAAMAGRIQRDPDTGVGVGQLVGIREGRLFRNNSSGVRGVSWHAGTGRWAARISDGGRMRTIGYFRTIDEAAEARRRAVLERYGEEND